MSNKKFEILVIVDMEGIIGVIDLNDTPYNVKLAYKEIECVIMELKSNGYPDITICNIHDDGTLLDEKEIKGLGAKLISGIHNLVDKINDFSLAILIGFHCKKNTGWRFDHTFRIDIDKIIYGGDNIGEVGAYCRWLALEDIPVIFVSGEGKYQEEINCFDCITHQIISVSESIDLIQGEYLLLRSLLISAIKLFKVGKISCPIIENMELYVGVNNTDKYTLLKKKFEVSEDKQYIIFPTMIAFFEQLYNLAVSLNEAEQIIYEQNMRLVKEIKQSKMAQQEIRDLLSDYLKKDISCINNFDRNIVAKRMGFQIEDSYNI